MAHQAGAYPGFSSMKQLGVFLFPPGCDASPSQGYPFMASHRHEQRKDKSIEWYEVKETKGFIINHCLEIFQRINKRFSTIDSWFQMVTMLN